jgi:hypothetical protein
MTTRRDFMKQGGAALGASLFAGSALAGIPNLLSAAPAPSSHALDVFYNAADVKELMAAALTAAKTAGASYADVREPPTAELLCSPANSRSSRWSIPTPSDSVCERW